MAQQPKQKVWLFIDAQNFYNDARRAFYTEDDPGSWGQVHPWKLGELLVAARLALGRPPCQLSAVRIYKGMPSSGRESKAYGAFRRQEAAWKAAGVEVFSRSLMYPDDWPKSKATEKGIDVALAVDLLYHAIRQNYEVAIVASTDTDLVPALAAVCEQRRAWGKPDLEVVAFDGNPKRLRVDAERVRCHILTLADFQSVEDRTNYRQPKKP